jgi:drug/metabolite transporter (DMT)-like permease
MDWFPLALLCAFSLASADAVTKRWLRNADAREIVLLRLGLTGVLLAPLNLIAPLPALPTAFWLWLAVLVPLELLAMLLYMRAIRDYPLALTLPYLAFTPVFVTLTGWVVLNERVDAQGLAGILLVVAGSWLLNARPRGLNAAELLRPFRAIFDNPGSRLMLAVALIYAVTSVGGKAAMQWLPAEQFGPFYFLLVGGAALLVFGLGRPRTFGVLRRHPWAGLAAAALSALMVVTHFLALERIETAYMIAVKRTSLLFGILYGALLFREPRLRQNLAAGGLMVAGVALIVL